MKWQGAWAVIAFDQPTPQLHGRAVFVQRYISFGTYLEGPGTDSFGVPDERIFYYAEPDEVEELFRGGHIDGWRILLVMPVAVGAVVGESPPDNPNPPPPVKVWV